MARCTLILFLIIASCLAWAGNSSYRQGGTSIYFTQLGHLKHQAELGDPNAQFLLGNLYLAPPPDTSIRQNLSKAVEYYFQAAIRNHAGAQFNLGVLYFRGEGVPMSKTMAAAWFTLASDNQSPVAKNIKRNARDSLDDLVKNFNGEQKNQTQQWHKTFKEIIDNQNYRVARLPEINS